MRLNILGLGLLVVVVGCGDDGVPIGGSTSDSTGAEPTTSGMVPTSSSTNPQTDTTPTTMSTSSTTEEPDDTTNGGSEATSLTASDTGSSTTDSTGPIIPETTSTSGEVTSGITTIGESGSFIIFIEEPDLGPAAECSVWDQDCPDGEKCNAWANDGGNSWNAWRCVPIDVAPVGLNEECTVEGSGVSGIDNCELGQMCWSVDPETNLGFCIGYCVPPEDSPTCVDDSAFCIVTNDGWLPICLPGCDPFLQDCDPGDACYGVEDAFACAPDSSGEMGAYFDPCEFINVCDPGLHCASVDNLPGCAGSGCCTPWCDLDGFMCPDDLDCVPYYPAGEAPPGYEDVGFCGVPT